MLLTGIVGLLVGGICGVLASWTIQHRTQSVGIAEALPAARPEVFSPEAARVLSATRVSFSPEAARAVNGYAPTVTLEAFSPEAIRSLSLHAPMATQEVFSPEAARARNG
jgi:hypothetical protein